MPYKSCPSCQQTSYSSCLSSIWLCPYCGKELTLCKAVHNARKLLSPRGNLHMLPTKK